MERLVLPQLLREVAAVEAAAAPVRRGRKNRGARAPPPWKVTSGGWKSLAVLPLSFSAAHKPAGQFADGRVLEKHRNGHGEVHRLGGFCSPAARRASSGRRGRRNYHSRPTCFRPRTSRQICASVISTCVLGATNLLLSAPLSKSGLGSALLVHLGVGRQRERRQWHEGRRHHVVGHLRLQEFAQRRGADFPSLLAR